MCRSWSVVTCVGDIGWWMCANRLRLNQDKTQLRSYDLVHGTDGLSFGSWQSRLLVAVSIKISAEAMCLGVLLDSALNFALHVRRPSGKSFYHLRQMNTVRKSLTEDVATTMVHAFVTSRVDYCNIASAVWAQPMSSLYRTCSTLQLEPYCVSAHHHWRSRSTTLAARSAENWIQSVCRSNRTNIPHWTVLTGVWISQSWSPPFRCT